MGVWKERGLEVKGSMRMDVKPCRHLNVYVSGSLDVHHPCDPPCRRGLAVVIARFLFAQNPMKKTSFCFAFGFARHNLSSSALQNLTCLRLRKTVLIKTSCDSFQINYPYIYIKHSGAFYGQQRTHSSPELHRPLLGS